MQNNDIAESNKTANKIKNKEIISKAISAMLEKINKLMNSDTYC